jgi:hypothetical protein
VYFVRNLSRGYNLRARIPLLLTVLSAFHAHPARAVEFRQYGMLIEPRISTGQDFQLGLRAGYGWRTWEGFSGSLFLDGEVRPFPDEVRLRSSPTFSYQYQEVRWSFGPGVSAGYDFSEGFTGTASLGLGYTDGVYWGSNRPPRHGWIGWAEGGFRQTLSERAYWGMALQYRPLPGIFPARVLLQFGFNFGEEISP